jgi:hypothetical protein
MKVFAIAIVVWLTSTVWLLTGVTPSSATRIQNCDLVEFSPDFPQEMKARCREARRK